MNGLLSRAVGREEWLTLNSERLSSSQEPQPGDALRRNIGELLQSRVPAVWLLPGGDSRLVPERRPRGVLSGSFNPLHAGHLALCEAAVRRLGGPVDFELSVVNAEKPPLDEAEVLRRCARFASLSGHALVLTAAPTFVEKARLLPDTTFVVGIDTAARIVNTRFYGGSLREMNQALAAIGEAGCRFLVAGRWIAGRFQTLSDVGVPAKQARLFDELTGEEFRYDVSSTVVRGE